MFRKISLLFIFLITSFLLNGCVTTTEPSDLRAFSYETGAESRGLKSGKYYIQVRGQKRDFVLTLPDNYDRTKSYPLVLAWHGMGGYAEQVALNNPYNNIKGYYGILEAADNQAIFIAGQGQLLPGNLNQGKTGWANTKGRDLAFAESLINWAEANLPVDSTKIFSVGVSFGGMFTNLLACKLGSRIRAIASISGHSGFPTLNNPYKQCKNEKVAAWFAHAKNDSIVPYKAGEKARDLLRHFNECSKSDIKQSQNGCIEMEGCADGYPVVWCTHQRGHMVPPFAGDEIWKFFSRFESEKQDEP